MIFRKRQIVGGGLLEILFLQNEVRRHCATRLDRLLAVRGARIHHYWATRNEFPLAQTAFDAVVIGGGPPNPNEDHDYLHRERDLIRAFAQTGRPMLGICLGSQLLAVSLCGSEQVFRRAAPEVGVLPVTLAPEAANDPLLRALPTPIELFVWHSDEVRTDHPDITLLGSTEACPNHLWRFRNAPVWGVQGHPEISGDRAHAWLDENAERLAADGANADDFRHAASRLCDAPRLINRFLEIAEGQKA